MRKFNNNRKKRPNTRKKSSKNKDFKELDSKESIASNDSKWYTGDSQLTFDAGRFNWVLPNGAPIDTDPNGPFTFPGVLALDVIPSVGISLDGNSVVNVAARKLYTWIRRSKSSYATYDPSDLMQYCIAVGQAYMYHNWLTRVYGILNVYSQVNRYIPDTLLSSNRINGSVRSSMADFLWYINKFGNLISSLAVPNTLPYFQRLSWMYSNIYTDDMTGKSTLFQFVPMGFHVYKEADAKLEFYNIQNESMALSHIINLGDTILEGILNSQDFWNISADILNAYGEDKLLRVAGVPVDYTVIPTFNLEVLSQIQNCWITGLVGNCDITQDTNGQLIFDPDIAVLDRSYSGTQQSITENFLEFLGHGKRIINMYKDQVTPDDVFVATRLVPTFEKRSDDKYHLSSTGTEFICKANMWWLSIDPDTGVRTPSKDTFCRCLNLGQGTTFNNNVYIQNIMRLLSQLSMTSYHPHVEVIANTDNTTQNIHFEYGDVANFTVMDDNDIAKLHTTALFSLFNVPTLGGFNG